MLGFADVNTAQLAEYRTLGSTCNGHKPGMSGESRVSSEEKAERERVTVRVSDEFLTFPRAWKWGSLLSSRGQPWKEMRR